MHPNYYAVILFRVFLNPLFGEPLVCTPDSRGFRHVKGQDKKTNKLKLFVAENGTFGTPFLTQKSPPEKVYVGPFLSSFPRS